MSYILDALRRAEADRERGHVPGLHAQPAPTVATSAGAASANGQRWTLPAFGALIAAVALLVWRPWAVEPPAPAAVPGAAVAPVAGNPASAVATAPVAPAPVPAAAPAPVPPVRTSTVPAAEAPARRVATAPTTVAAKKRSSAAASSAAAQPSGASGPASAVAADEKVYSLAELPPEVRQQLPPVAIGGSIYSASPASRFVIVNGQLFHEGDTLAPGLVLQQIRLKSAVLSFRGYRYGISF